MTTTIMRDSVVGDAWIQQTAAACPVQKRVDANNNFNGEIITGPVRLYYADVFEVAKPRPGQTQQGEPKYGSQILFTPYADFSILYEEYYRVCGREFAEYYDAPSGQYYGLHSPFRAQAEKIKSGGYTPGLTFMSCKTKFKPSVVDARMNPIVDRSKVYNGVWAICAINAYPYGKNPKQPKFGVGFGLQSIMIIGDDTRLGGGKPSDPRASFAGINIQAPVVRPDIANMPSGGAPAPHQPPASYAPAAPAYSQPGAGANTAYPSNYGQQAAPLPPGHQAPAPYAGGPTPPTSAYGAPTTYPGETEDQRIMREMGLV